MTFLPETKENKFLKIYKDEKEYRADSGSFNYSKLADFVKEPLPIFRAKHITKTLPFKTTPEMDFGSLVDCMKFEPHFKDDKFGITSAPTPTEGPLKFVNELIELVKQGDGGVNSENLKEAYDRAGIKSPGYEKFILEKFSGTQVESYFAEKLENTGKIVLDFEGFERAERVLGKLNNSDNTREIFLKGKEQETFAQYPIGAIIEGYPIRVLLDFLKVCHKTKTIYPYDLKCLGTNIEDFGYTFFKSKYYVQAGLYEAVVRVWAEHHYKGYTVEPFQFIVADSSGFLDPLVYQILPPAGQDFLHTFKVGERTYKSGINIIKELEFHTKNNIWTVRQNNIGKITIQL